MCPGIRSSICCLMLTCTSAQAFVTVGSSPGSGSCDFATIGAALTTGDDEIRLLSQSFFEDVLIEDDVQLIGGFDTCADADSNIQGDSLTLINGSGAGPVVSLVNASELDVELRNLWIQGGVGSGSNDGGGIRVAVGGQLDINNTLLLSNQADSGGGININNPPMPLDVTMVDSTIIGNSAGFFGGGLFCRGDVEITVDAGTGIAGNVANRGGGVYQTLGCVLILRSGVDSRTDSSLIGVVNNTANEDGGGLYLDQGAFVSIEGDADHPAAITGNTATASGGGIYVVGSGSTVSLLSGLFEGNDAGNGGGVAASTGALIVSRVDSPGCWNRGKCILFDGNTAARGGAIHVALAATASLSQVSFANNRANLGTALYLRDPQSNLFVEGSEFYGNGNGGVGGWNDSQVIRVYGGNTQLKHVTVANNSVVVAAIGVTTTGGAASLYVYNSIIHNAGVEPADYVGTPFTEHECLVVNELGQLNGTGIIITDPEFKNPGQNDYRLSGDSVAIDLCADRSANYADLEGQVRGWDDPSYSNASGPFDAGADESYLNDIFFLDTFSQ
ncbi:MAG: hypothetical protein DHS20C11_25300 [Lysobacteraceae bacterium]|nr:MAG: hypothetical protein DHS20C11_25300 [Xanthomonadaceae bacterium]